MDIRRTRRRCLQPHRHRSRGTGASFPPPGWAASAPTVARRSRPESHSARTAGPGSPREPPRDAFMAGQSSPTLGAAVKSSEVSGFYKKSPDDRWQVIQSFGELSDAEIETIRNTGALKVDQGDRMIENVVGSLPIPLGIAGNFRVNERDYLVPMAIEEPTVVAAASNAARMARERGGFSASTSGPIMIGQIQLVGVLDPHGARMTILHHRGELRATANEKAPRLRTLCGGASGG